MKTNRNAPCPCGSGKKYKLCCLNQKPSSSAISSPSTVNGKYPPIDPTKHPDTLIHGYLKQDVYTITYVYNSPLPKYGTSPQPEGYPGEYHVEFTLQPPSRIVMDSTEYNVGSDIPGGSLLAIAKPVPRSKHDVAAINVEVSLPLTTSTEVPVILRDSFSPNNEGFLSTIKVRLNAQNCLDAENTAYKHLAPILSEWAFVHDVPLDIARIRTEAEYVNGN